MDDNENMPASSGNPEISIIRKLITEKRLLLMLQGGEDLQNGLVDLMREGLATLQETDNTFCQTLAARMVDSKMGNLARSIRKLEDLLPSDSPQWPEECFTQLSRLFLAVKGLNKINQLPAALQDDLLAILGVNIKKETLLKEKKPEKGCWLVVAQTDGTEERLRFRKTWLMTDGHPRFALILEFVFGNADFPSSWQVGEFLGGEMVFYPSAHPLRAVPVELKRTGNPGFYPEGYKTFQPFFDAYSLALAANPWLPSFPVLLSDVSPLYHNDSFLLLDKNHHTIPLQGHPSSNWKLMSLSGGHPIEVFGEWAGNNFLPLSVFTKKRLVVI